MVKCLLIFRRMIMQIQLPHLFRLGCFLSLWCPTLLEAKEINTSMDPRKFTMHEILNRLNEKRDLFANLLNKKVAAANNKILKNM